MSKYDAIFVGTSPNALAAAARLARSGLSILMLDTRSSVGGPVATDEFAPGFRVDSGVMSAALDPQVASELDISLDVIHRDSVTALGSTPVTLGADFTWPTSVLHAVDLLRAVYASDPPDVPSPTAAEGTALSVLTTRLSTLGSRDMHEVLRLLLLSARDFCQEQFDSHAVQGILGGIAVRGVSQGPFASGTLLNFLHHLALHDGLVRATVRGGLGRLAECLADKARGAGAEIVTQAPGPLRIHIQDGAATAVHLADGRQFDAHRIVSDQDARVTLTQLVPPHALEPEFNRTVRNIRYKGSVARVHLALRDLPRWKGLDESAYRGTLVVSPSIDYLEQAWDQGKRGVMSSHPYIEVTLPTVADPSLAPEGKHILSAWVQYVPYGCADRPMVLKTVLDQLEQLAPGLAALVIHHQVMLPADIEEQFGLTEGHLYGGEICWNQAFFLRPFPGFSGYRTPIDNLYMVGSAAHPGGYSGRSGWNLARIIGHSSSRPPLDT